MGEEGWGRNDDQLSFCQVSVGQEDVWMGQTDWTYPRIICKHFLEGLTFAIVISCSHCLVQSWAIIMLIGVCWTIKACASLLSPPQIPQSRLFKMQPTTLHGAVYLIFGIIEGKTEHYWSKSFFSLTKQGHQRVVSFFRVEQSPLLD